MAKAAKKSAKSSSRSATRKPPWKRANPRKRAGKSETHLTPGQEAAAKAMAKRAGRPYPNLVDNMRVAKKAKKKSKKASKKSKSAAKKATKTSSAAKASRKLGKRETGSAKKRARKSSAKTSSRKPSAQKTSKRASEPEKDPHGGLTASGRRAFARRDGSHLKPGVTKSQSEMTPAEMRRKGSWAVRFYGRAKLPPLTDKAGEPTRFALSAHAWGEPVPRTEAAARRIAAKGERLLARYRRLRDT